MKNVTRKILLGGVLCGLFGAVNARAETVPVDSIVAVVEDAAIFQSEVNQTVKQIILQQGKSEPTQAERAALEEQVLVDLINAKLIVAKAGRLGIEVSFAEIERHVEQTIDDNRRNLGGEQGFQRALEAEGLTLPELKQFIREQVRNRMLVERVLASEIDRSSLAVSDESLLALYEERKNMLPLRPAVVHLRTIYLAMESSQSASGQAKARIDSLYDRVLRGEDFAELAREYSEDPNAENGGVLGTLKISDLSDPDFAEAAAALSIGEVSEPVKTSYGYHLIKMTGANPASEEVELSHILIRVKPGVGDVQEVFELADEIHAKLVAGAPFDSMATQYSDDKATAANGGDLGWLRVEDLPEFFREVLETLKPGDISQVLREPSGFRIVELLASEEARPYIFPEVKDDLRKLAEQEKLAEAYDEYLTGLRDEFYVDVR
jgi:peptidyl-prolyl cis-trans isomerase SurA